MKSLENIWKPTEYPNIEVSYTGQVRKIYKNTKPKILAQMIKKSRPNRVVVHIVSDGIDKHVPVHQLVAKAFCGKCPDGCVVYHKNGVITDNFAMNIGYISRKELGRKTGGNSNSKSVVVLDKNGEEVNWYKSARSCAKDYFCSHQTVISRCNNKDVKNPFGDIDFAWEDDGISIRNARKRLGVNL